MTAPADHPPHAPSRESSSLAAIYLFTFANSIGTGMVSNGIFFLTRQGFDFSAVANFGLGVLLGVMYIAGALLAGPLFRRLQRSCPAVSRRGWLAVIMVLMAVLAAVPWLSVRFLGPSAGPGAVWVLVLLYSPLSGMLWPLVEAFLAGGRSGKPLRSAIGTWNVVWCTATVAAYLVMGPLIKHHAAPLLVGLGVLHLASALTLLWFTPEPGSHGPAGEDEHDAPHDPELYRQLLATFRLLLPTSYVISSALGPYLPLAFEKTTLEPAWHAAAASTWNIARVLTFFTLQRWHGWHGRWSTAIVGGAVLLLGFALCISAPIALTGTPLLVVMIAGLALFGVGMATIYTAAIYYAMAVGQAEVDAGGTHEALIGVGYAAGPLFGLVASLAISREVLPPSALEPSILTLVSGIALGVTIVVIRRVRRAARARRA